MRDAAYEMQLLAKLRELHKLAADAIEAVYADDLAPHFADLAYHFEKAKLHYEQWKMAVGLLQYGIYRLNWMWKFTVRW